jgi:hypothetical protein
MNWSNPDLLISAVVLLAFNQWWMPIPKWIIVFTFAMGLVLITK